MPLGVENRHPFAGLRASVQPSPESGKDPVHATGLQELPGVKVGGQVLSGAVARGTFDEESGKRATQCAHEFTSASSALVIPSGNGGPQGTCPTSTGTRVTSADAF
ncbi:hypothetical protein GCM10027267_21370 [Paramicrobacterium agarici]